MSSSLFDGVDEGRGRTEGVGSTIFVMEKENLSFGFGEEITLPIVLSVEEYSKYHLYYFVDQDVLISIEWYNSIEGEYRIERTESVPSSFPDGAIMEGRILSRKLRLRITNNSPEIPPADLLTSFYVAIYASR